MTNKRILTLITLLLFLFLLVGCDWITPNQPPEITSDPVETATAGVDYTYNVVANDPNDGDVLTYSLTTEPEGMLIGEDSGVITWIPDAVGDFDVVVVVSDEDGLSDTQDFTIEVVVPKLPVNNITQDEYYNTIQAAIDDANLYDTIEVAAGVYDDIVDGLDQAEVVINVDGITLKSVEKHGAEIKGRISVEADDITIEDFYINLDINITDKPPVDLVEVDGVTIRGNKVEGSNDAKGIQCCTGPADAKGLILIEDNEIIKGPIGLYLCNESALVTIKNNMMIEPMHEGIWTVENLNAVLIIENNTVIDAGLNDVKIGWIHDHPDKPVSINGVTDETKMAKAIFDTNLGINSVELLWTGGTWFR